MNQFKQIYSIDREKLTKREMLQEIGFDQFTSDRIAKKLKKHIIKKAWLDAYNQGCNFYALEIIKKEL